MVEGKGNVQITLLSKKMVYQNVHYVLGMDKNLLFVNEIMKQIACIHVIFNDHKCFFCG